MLYHEVHSVCIVIYPVLIPHYSPASMPMWASLRLTPIIHEIQVAKGLDDRQIHTNFLPTPYVSESFCHEHSTRLTWYRLHLVFCEKARRPMATLTSFTNGSVLLPKCFLAYLERRSKHLYTEANKALHEYDIKMHVYVTPT